MPQLVESGWSNMYSPSLSLPPPSPLPSSSLPSPFLLLSPLPSSSLPSAFPLGSPKYFDPILHYLRSGVLEIPPGISRTTLLKEAEFYGLQTIVTRIEHIEAEKKKKPAVKSKGEKGRGGEEERERRKRERKGRKSFFVCVCVCSV